MGHGRQSPSWVEHTATLPADEQARLYTNLADSLQSVRRACNAAFENDEIAVVLHHLDAATRCLATVRQTLAPAYSGETQATATSLAPVDGALGSLV